MIQDAPVDILPLLKQEDSYGGQRCSANSLRWVPVADRLTARFTSQALRACPALKNFYYAAKSSWPRFKMLIAPTKSAFSE